MNKMWKKSGPGISGAPRSKYRKNFRVNDEEESICGDALDPCGVCLTKGQTRDGTLVNRMLLCGFAIVLVWASSLSTAIFIANSSISSPTSEAVNDACHAAYELTRNERADYTECVDRQLAQCDRRFEQILNEQVALTNAQLEANAAVVANAVEVQERCQDAFATAQAAITAWTSGGVDYLLHYSCR